MSTNIFERLKSKESVPLNDPNYGEIREACMETKRLLLDLNNTAKPEDIRELLGRITNTDIDDSVTVFTPIHINYGKNTRFGRNIFVNFDCTFLDLGGIEIEDNVMIGPGVKLLSEGHPVAPDKRQQLTAEKIHIKKNVWIGANAIILQGVTIGENAVVAAGAVVSKSVPDNSVAGGIPARILKTI